MKKKEIALKDINIKSLFKENMTKEEKQMARIVEREILFNIMMDKMTHLDYEEKKKQFENFEIKSKIDEDYVLSFVESLKQVRWMSECLYHDLGTVLNDIVDMILFLYDRFECVQNEYPWLKEFYKHVEYEQ